MSRSSRFAGQCALGATNILLKLVHAGVTGIRVSQSYVFPKHITLEFNVPPREVKGHPKILCFPSMDCNDPSRSVALLSAPLAAEVFNSLLAISAHWRHSYQL